MAQTDKTAAGKKNRKNTQSGTQTHLRIAEIRDNTVILKNGGLRAVLKTTSINFNLKSEEEQNSIIIAYQNFLNSLEFPIQILVRSRKLDIDNYIDQIKALGEKQPNKLLQEQTFEYAQYIKRLVEYADIMEKEFYVIVSYDPARSQGINIFQSFFQRLSPKDTYSDVKKRHKEFNELSKKLAQRVNIVAGGLESCGLKVKELNTSELIELFYNVYNPLISRTSKLKNLAGTAIQTDQEKIDLEKKKEE